MVIDYFKSTTANGPFPYQIVPVRVNYNFYDASAKSSSPTLD